MRSMLRSRSLLPMLLVLSMALSPSCCKRPAQPAPVQPVVRVPVSCLTPELLAARPGPIATTLMDCLSQGNSAADCVAHDDRVREAYIVRLLANCGAKP